MKIAFDTETTGTNVKKDELLQISIVDDNYNILLNTYIHPPTRTDWYHAEKVNHISYNMVKDAPSYAEVTPIIQDIFNQATEIIGYNVNFDINIVEAQLGIQIDRSKVRDLLKEFRDETKKKNISMPHHKLGNAVDYYCPEYKSEYLSNAHDANCDTLATMRVANAIDIDHTRNIPNYDISDDNLKDFFDLEL